MCDLQFRRQGLNSSCSVSCQSTTSPPFNPKLLTFGDVSDAWEVPASDLRSRGGPDGEACTQRARSFGCRHLTAGAGTPRRSKVAGQGVWRAPAARTGLGANMATHSSGATKLISLAPPSVYPLREGRNFQSLARPRRRARRSPVPPLDQLRVPPARHTLFAPQRARKPCCKLIIIAAALCVRHAQVLKTHRTMICKERELL